MSRMLRTPRDIFPRCKHGFRRVARLWICTRQAAGRVFPMAAAATIPRARLVPQCFALTKPSSPPAPAPPPDRDTPPSTLRRLFPPTPALGLQVLITQETITREIHLLFCYRAATCWC